jgi:hypothetical protein
VQWHGAAIRADPLVFQRRSGSERSRRRRGSHRQPAEWRRQVHGPSGQMALAEVTIDAPRTRSTLQTCGLIGLLTQFAPLAFFLNRQDFVRVARMRGDCAIARECGEIATLLSRAEAISCCGDARPCAVVHGTASASSLRPRLGSGRPDLNNPGRRIGSTWSGPAISLTDEDRQDYGCHD